MNGTMSAWPRTVVAIASLLGVIFHALLRKVSVIYKYCCDKLKRSLDKTNFVNRHINLIVCWKRKQIRFFSFLYWNKFHVIRCFSSKLPWALVFLGHSLLPWLRISWVTWIKVFRYSFSEAIIALKVVFFLVRWL